jgi:hypothetical protein
MIIYVYCCLHFDIVWKPPQPLDCPLGATYDSIESQTSLSVNVTTDRGKNIIGTRYFDSEGNSINRVDIEKDRESRNDPVWISLRTGGSTSLDTEGYVFQIDDQTEKLVAQMKKDLVGELKSSPNGYEGPVLLHAFVITYLQQCGQRRGF